MSSRAQFKPHYHIEWVEGEGVYLLSESEQRLLRGQLYERVAPLIDGRRSATDIVDHLRIRFRRRSELRAEQAGAEGYLAECEDRLPAGEAALWAMQSIEPQVAARRLAETRVSVTAWAAWAGPFLEILHWVHVQVGEGGQLGVVLTDDYLRRGLQAYNREALRGGRPWLLVKSVGCQIWVGPVFRPGKTGCWDCFAQRLGRNRAGGGLLARKKGCAEPVPVARAVTPATLQLAWNLAATEIAAWIVKDGASDLEGKILTLDVRDWQTRTHILVRRPQCPACGRPDDSRERALPPLVLQSRKTFTEDGGHGGPAPKRRWHATSIMSARLPGPSPCWKRPARPGTVSSTCSSRAPTSPPGPAPWRDFGGGFAPVAPARARATCRPRPAGWVRPWSVLGRLSGRRTPPQGPPPGAGRHRHSPQHLHALQRAAVPGTRGLECPQVSATTMSRWRSTWRRRSTGRRSGRSPVRRCAICPRPTVTTLLHAISRGGVLRGLLQRQRGGQHPGRSHPARLPGAGRARQRGPVVVQPRPASGRLPGQLRRPVPGAARRVPARPAARPLGPGLDLGLANPRLRGPVPAHRPAGGKHHVRVWSPSGPADCPVAGRDGIKSDAGLGPGRGRRGANGRDPGSRNRGLAGDRDPGQSALPGPRRPHVPGGRGLPAALGGRPQGGCPGLPGAGRGARHGNAGAGPDPARHRHAGRQGVRARFTALLGPLRPGRLYEVPVRLGWLPQPLAEEQLNPISMFL